MQHFVQSNRCCVPAPKPGALPTGPHPDIQLREKIRRGNDRQKISPPHYTPAGTKKQVKTFCGGRGCVLRWQGQGRQNDSGNLLGRLLTSCTIFCIISINQLVWLELKEREKDRMKNDFPALLRSNFRFGRMRNSRTAGMAGGCVAP